MALASLPAYAYVRELRLCIKNPTDDVRLPLTLQQKAAPAFRELWSGDVLLAGVARTNADKLAAWIETLDGRVTPFKLALGAGKFSQAASFTASLAAAPALGASVIALSLSPTSGTILAGTLFTVGDIESNTFQLFEVLQDVDAAATVSVAVAPRVRKAFTLASAVDMGDVEGKFIMASNSADVTVALQQGLGVLSVVEAL